MRRSTHPLASGRRILLLWLLPLLWVLGLVGATRFHGDEYGMLAMASLPGWWLAVPLQKAMEGSLPKGGGLAWLWVIALGGALPLMGMGFVLDRCRAAPWKLLAVALGLTGLLAWTQIGGFEFYARALSKNGSLWAYLLGSWGVVLPATALGACLVLPPLRWLKDPQHSASEPPPPAGLPPPPG